MTADKEGRPAQRKGSTGRGKRRPSKGTSEEEQKSGRGPATVIDVDPWSILLDGLFTEPERTEEPTPEKALLPARRAPGKRKA